MSNTTWRKLITEEMSYHDETWDDVAGQALGVNDCSCDEDSAPSFDTEFYDGFGGADGCHFTVWTAKRVYFPVVYDGAESVGSAPRNPCSEACAHVGGQ